MFSQKQNLIQLRLDFNYTSKLKCKIIILFIKNSKYPYLKALKYCPLDSLAIICLIINITLFYYKMYLESKYNCLNLLIFASAKQNNLYFAIFR